MCYQSSTNLIIEELYLRLENSRNIGPLYSTYSIHWEHERDFHNWKWHDAKGRGALCPPKMMSLPNQEPQNSKPKLKPKDNFPFCLLPARLRRLLTGVAFRLDECPRNVISCNISWRHPACQVRDIFFHWCENLQNGILSSLRAQELGFLAQKGPNLVQNMYFWSFWAKYWHFWPILSHARWHLRHIRHQNTKTSLYKLSKNGWVCAFF